MRITTNAHRDAYGLTVEIRGHVARLHPAVLAARVAEAVNESARVLLIPPDPDVPTPSDVDDDGGVECPVEDPSCEGSDEQCHDACEPSEEHAAALRDAVEGAARRRAVYLLNRGRGEREVAELLGVTVEQIRAWDDEPAEAPAEEPPSFGTASTPALGGRSR